MSELCFVGLGLYDEKDLSARARELLLGCDELYAEEYTSVWSPDGLVRLARDLGHPIHRLERSDVESERPILAALSRSPRVGFLVVGDPFSATTHVALRLAAERAGHVWRYVPNASVLTAAAGFLGLMPYRFGRPTSLPFPEPGYAPTSPLDILRANRSAGLHTLVLLDLRPSESRFLTATEGIRILAERDGPPASPLFAPELPLAVVARVGSDSARAWYGRRDRLERVDFGPPMHTLVVPAPELHFEEAEAVRRFAVDR